MTVKISKDALNLREELASLRNQGGLPKEDKLYVDGLVTNGNFGTNSDWTLSANWEISNGQLHANSTAAYTTASQTLNTTAGKTYKATVTCTSHTAGTFRLYVHDGGGYEEYVQFNTTGTYSVTWKAHTNSDRIRVYGFGGSLGEASFDNVSVQEVGENLVENGDFKQGATASEYDGWAVVNSPTSTTFGNGVTIVTTNYTALEQYVDVEVGTPYTVMVDVTALNPNDANDAGRLYLGVYGDSDLYLNDNTLGIGTHTFTVTPTDTRLRIRLATKLQAGQVTFANFRVYQGLHPVIQSIPHGYDVKDVYIDGELAREGEGYDYEVKTDGINQWLKPTVEPTSTTETVVIGVRK